MSLIAKPQLTFLFSLSHFKFQNIFHCHNCPFEKFTFVLMQVSKTKQFKKKINNLTTGNLRYALNSLHLFYSLFLTIRKCNGSITPMLQNRKEAHEDKVFSMPQSPTSS